jgi:hypothetical protein
MADDPDFRTALFQFLRNLSDKRHEAELAEESPATQEN